MLGTSTFENNCMFILGREQNWEYMRASKIHELSGTPCELLVQYSHVVVTKG